MDYYNYKKELIVCTKCSWKGEGKLLNQGELYNELFELNCPKCDVVVGFVSLPTFDEVLEKGTEEEKKEVRLGIEWNKKVEKTQIKSIKNLPEINESLIIIETKEISSDDEDWLEIYANKKLLWSEIIWYEYYNRLIEIFKMLGRKYKDRIEEINYEVSYNLMGDTFSVTDKIESCINKIKQNKT